MYSVLPTCDTYYSIGISERCNLSPLPPVKAIRIRERPPSAELPLNVSGHE
jgi:hypothetical protein